MRLIEHGLGSRLDATISEQLHQLEHRGLVDSLVVRSADIQRRRFRARTVKGEEVAIALTRDQTLYDGAVLAIEDDHALIVDVPQTRWLRCVPRDASAALELGYNAGNLHWRVRFDGAALLVAQEAPLGAYVSRLGRLLDSGAISIEPEDGC